MFHSTPGLMSSRPTEGSSVVEMLADLPVSRVQNAIPQSPCQVMFYMTSTSRTAFRSCVTLLADFEARNEPFG